jgi:hypothetical protein
LAKASPAKFANYKMGEKRSSSEAMSSGLVYYNEKSDGAYMKSVLENLSAEHGRLLRNDLDRKAKQLEELKKENEAFIKKENDTSKRENQALKRDNDVLIRQLEGAYCRQG